MHCVRKVTDDLWWVGANDRRTALFENIHPIPRGVSYNSYLLLDEKTVLFDAVDWSAAPQLIENVEYLLDGRELDYVICHHLEPDHGAGLWCVLKRWPNAKVVGSAQALTFMGQFGVAPQDADKTAVKEGDTLSFGKHALTFYTAPMVHWPDALISLDEVSGCLFTADAFGSFISLDGKLFNDEVNYDRDWIDEARRYYTNIVGKYGAQTQAVLKKAAGILDKVKFICPLHGLVWRNNFDYLIGKYDKWSRYEPEEKGALIVYGSMYGGTEQAAEALSIALTERGVPVTLRDASSTHVSELIAQSFRYSHIVLASVTYNMGIYPPVKDYLEDMKALALKGRTFAILENGTWAPASGKLITAFVTEELKGTLLEQKVTLKSTLKKSQADELEALANALAASIKG